MARNDGPTANPPEEPLQWFHSGRRNTEALSDHNQPMSGAMAKTPYQALGSMARCQAKCALIMGLL
jgi:hypothetical protein